MVAASIPSKSSAVLGMHILRFIDRGERRRCRWAARTKFLMPASFAVRATNWVSTGPSCRDLRVGVRCERYCAIVDDRTDVEAHECVFDRLVSSLSGLGNPETREDRNLYHIQDEGEGSRRRKRPGHEQGRQWPHCDSADGQCRGDRDIGNGRHGKPEARARTPQMPAFTNGIDRRLAPEHQDDERPGFSAPRLRDSCQICRRPGRRCRRRAGRSP